MHFEPERFLFCLYFCGSFYLEESDLTQKCYFSLTHEVFPWAQLWQKKASSNTPDEASVMLELERLESSLPVCTIRESDLQCMAQKLFRCHCSPLTSPEHLGVMRAGSDTFPAVATISNKHSFCSCLQKHLEYPYAKQGGKAGPALDRLWL